MRVGVSTFPTSYSIDPALLARRAEEMGFSSFWVPEHPIIPVHTTSPFHGSPDGVIPDYYAEIVDPFVALARASATTTTIKLATGICLVPERNPILLAKEVATLDRISGGRLIFGIGAGWLREETEIMGGDFDHRWGQTRDAVLAMKELWGQDEAEYHGKFYDFPPVRSFPKPLQQPNPPIYLGAWAQGNVFKRVARYGDGWMPSRSSPEEVRAGRESLVRAVEDVGRDPASIQVLAYGVAADRELIRAYEEAGTDEVVVRVATADEQRSLAELDSIARAVLT
ncbi:MAG: LLM class F420-dependent oxidoreductase [Dehalococcoidia bacterium]|nr:LLM class F420-dependent oxidoreductase [Dehalococcoidia bacterium]